MGLRIDEVRNIYASLLHVNEMERKPKIPEENPEGERDCFVSSIGSDDLLQTTGNYDDQGQMDDDFAVNLTNENDDLSGAAQFGTEYSEQMLKTVAGSEAAGGGFT